MINLLEETLDILKENNKTEKDVKWCGTTENEISWENFKEVADIKYDNGFGGQEIPNNLIVVGEDWWLGRGEYDGSEWWVFYTLPARPESSIKINNWNEWLELFRRNYFRK